MVLFNYSTKELTAKVVYYGPGLCGKTTNLQYIHENLPGNVRGKMLSLATKTDRTLFFDFLPIDLGEIRGMKTRVQLYTVPGQVFYNETRKLVLKGADGIVFVADSQEPMVSANVESFKNLEENLRAHGMKLSEIPHVIQFNKRDLPKLSSIEELNTAINHYNAPFYEAVATTGIGVQDSLKAITKLVLLHLTRKYESKTRATAASARVATPVAAATTPSATSIPVMTADPVSPPQAVPIPVATMMPTAENTPAAAAPTPPPVATHGNLPAFGEDDIDSLVDEVEETSIASAGQVAVAVEATTVASGHDAMPVDSAPDLGSAVPIDVPATESVAAYDSSVPAVSVEPVAGIDIIEGEAEQLAPIDEPVEDTDEAQTIGTADPEMESPPEEPDPTRSGVDEDAPVLLTEIAADADLFCDPSLEVARMATNEVREIVVPVEVGDAETGLRRYKLSISLRLDPVESE